MDPTQCYLEMYRAMQEQDYNTARDRALDLKRWLDNGGFYPSGYTELEVRNYLFNVLRRVGPPFA